MQKKWICGEDLSATKFLEILRKTPLIFHIFPTIKDKSFYIAMRKTTPRLDKMKSKGQEMSLDYLDRQILQLLQENAKQTYSEIGAKLDVAHSTVYDRIQKMEQAGFITKYEAMIDPERIGVPLITAQMTITTDPKETENIAVKMTEFGQVLEVATSFSEELVVIAKVVARNQAELHSFVARSVAPLPGVLRIRTAIVTKKYKEERFSLGQSKRAVSQKE